MHLLSRLFTFLKILCLHWCCSAQPLFLRSVYPLLRSSVSLLSQKRLVSWWVSFGRFSMLNLLLGDPNARKLKRYQPIVSYINQLEEEIPHLSGDELLANTAAFH